MYPPEFTEIVRAAHQAGHSVREIAKATGANWATVRRRIFGKPVHDPAQRKTSDENKPAPGLKRRCPRCRAMINTKTCLVCNPPNA